MRPLRRFTDHFERHVELDLAGQGFRVQDEFGVWVGAAEQPAASGATRRRWKRAGQARRSSGRVTLGGFLIQQSTHRSTCRFPPVGLLAFGRQQGGLDPRRFLTSGLSHRLLSPGCRQPRGLLALGFQASGFDARRGLTSSLLQRRLLPRCRQPRGLLAFGFQARGLDTR